MKLYRRYGIKSVTMDDVASQLGISKKTIYEYYRDKEDLVSHVLMFEFEYDCNFLQSISGRQLNAVEELFEVYRLINEKVKDFNPSMQYDIRKYYPDLFMKFRELKRKRMYDSVHGNLLQGKREGLYRKELNAKIIAKMHMHRIESMLDHDFFTQEELSSVRVFHELFVYHMQGILSPEGRQFFEQNFSRFKVSLPATPDSEN